MREAKPRDLLSIALLGLAVALVLSLASRNPLFLAPFRESQTAIGVDYLVKEPVGGFLAYQLPVFGEPWRIPHEFPLVQQMSAGLSRMGVNVSLAGRLVNLFGLAACIPAMLWLWHEWRMPRSTRAILLSFILCSPLYAAYSTAHMIESWALFFALLHVAAAWRFAATGRWRWCALLLCTGVLAALVKITTWLPAGFLVAASILPWMQGAKRVRWDVFFGITVSLGVVLGAGVAWTEWTASIRANNVLNEAVQNEAFLRTWVFGTVTDRLSLTNWLLAGAKSLLLIFGPLGLAVPLMLSLAFRNAVSRRAAVEIRVLLLGVAGYIVHLAVFLRLNLRHDYYMYGAGVYLVAALCAAYNVMPLLRSRGLAVTWVVSMAACTLCYVELKRGYQDFVVERSIAAIGAIKQPGILVMFGFDWSAQVPLATGRKAMMLPGKAANEQVLRSAIGALRNSKIAGIAVIGSEYDALALLSAQLAGFERPKRVPFWSNGYLLVDGRERMTGTTWPMPESINRLLQHVPRDKIQRDGLVFQGSLWPKRGGDALEFVVKRGSDAFYLRLLHLELVRVRGYFPATSAAAK